MHNEKELMLKIELLQQENRKLKNLLGNYNRETQKELTSPDLTKHLSNITKSINSRINQSELIQIILQELSLRTGTTTAYYLQLNQTITILYKLTQHGKDATSPIFTEKTISSGELSLNRKNLLHSGFFTVLQIR